jgi:hypothetical protein
MTNARTNEAIRRENQAKKTLTRKQIYHNDLGGHARCKDSITIKKAEDFVKIRDRGIELMVLTYTLSI